MNRFGVAVAVVVSCGALGMFGAFVSQAAAAGSDDRVVAETILKEVEHDEAHKSLAAEAVANAHSALERAARMRSGGDEAHARLADGLARDWAEGARDLVGAATVETRAHAAQRDALDAGARVERERALLEEAIARVGRLRAQLDDAEKEKVAPTPVNVTAVGDGGASKKAPAPRTGNAAGNVKATDAGAP